MRSTRFNQPLYRQRTGTAAPARPAAASLSQPPATPWYSPPQPVTPTRPQMAYEPAAAAPTAQTQTNSWADKRDRAGVTAAVAKPVAKPRPVMGQPADQKAPATSPTAAAAPVMASSGGGGGTGYSREDHNRAREHAIGDGFMTVPMAVRADALTSRRFGGHIPGGGSAGLALPSTLAPRQSGDRPAATTYPAPDQRPVEVLGPPASAPRPSTPPRGQSPQAGNWLQRAGRWVWQSVVRPVLDVNQDGRLTGRDAVDAIGYGTMGPAYDLIRGDDGP